LLPYATLFRSKAAPPNIAVPTASVPMTVRLNERLRNSLSGTTGSETFASTRIASARTTAAPPRYNAVVVDHQSNWSPASETQMSTSATPPTMSVAPSQSIFTSRLITGSFSVLPRTISASTAIGTQTQKHQRQPSGESTMMPPSSGPDTVATANVAPM